MLFWSFLSFFGPFWGIFQAHVLMPSILFYSNVDLTSKMYQMCSNSKFPKQISLKEFQNMKNDNFGHLGLFLDPAQPPDDLYWINSAMRLYNKSRSVVLVYCWRLKKNCFHKLCFFGHFCPFLGHFGAIFQAHVLMPSIWFYSNVNLTSKMYQMCANSKFPKQISFKNFQNTMKNDNFCHLGLFLDPAQPPDDLDWINSAMRLCNKSRLVVLVNCWR